MTASLVILLASSKLSAEGCRWKLMQHSAETGMCFSSQAACESAAYRQKGGGYWCSSR